MGEAPHGLGGQDELSAEEKKEAARAEAVAARVAEMTRRVRLIEEKADACKFDTRTIGSNVPRLVELVTWALEGYAAAEFGISDLATLRVFEQARGAVAKSARQLLKAVANLHAIMPREEGEEGFDEALGKHTWLKFADHFEGAIADLLCESAQPDRLEAQRVAGEVRRAVSRIGAVSVPKSAGGRPQGFDVAGVVAAAVCYYRHEQDMPPLYWWGAIEPPVRRRGQIDDKPAPETPVGWLIALVAEAFELGVSNSQLRRGLDNYQSDLKASSRGPRMGDLRPLSGHESIPEQ